MSDSSKIAKLGLENGAVFSGRFFGATGTSEGEVVFNTSMTGYQEILTDPSYKGQIVTMTYPLIGNYGINRHDVESKRPHVAGFIIKELSPIYSNYRADLSLDEYLKQNKIIGIEGFGITVVDQIPIETDPTPENARYLATKRDKLGHKLHHQDLRFDADE